MTNGFAVEVSVQLGSSTPSEDFEELFTEIADAFFDSDGMTDHDLAGNTESGVLTFSMRVPVATEVEALTIATGAVRSAIHAAHGATAGWDDDVQTLHTMIASGSHLPVLAEA